ncbi:hypothetical protein [Tsuneonella flava]|uniref:hypothetical protein n=1 Tax=Tsuneonella flava TaxID=2055955 RepID=UPI000C804826|nr:hypothetical protein [Tsuneonella flava]
MTRNPASQIASTTRSNDAYAWTGHANVDRNYTTNGLNQYTAAGPASFTYDANGNLTSDGSNTYVYDVESFLNFFLCASPGPSETQFVLPHPPHLGPDWTAGK